MRSGGGPLRCVPFNALWGRKSDVARAIGHEQCREGKRGRLLQPPTAEAYLSLLGPRARPPAATILDLSLQEAAARAAGDPAPVVEYDALARALQAAAASTVVYLPSRLTVRPESVPAEVLHRLKKYCTTVGGT